MIQKRWEKVDGEWMLKNEREREEYESAEKQVARYENQLHWNKTRIPKQMYYVRKDEIERNGIGRVNLKWQETGNLGSLRVTFPKNFRHLINSASVREKESTPESFHISVYYRDSFEKIKEDFYEFMRNVFFDNWEYEVNYTFWTVRVTQGSTYSLEGDTPFERHLRRLVQGGTGKDRPHISLD